MKDDAFKLVDRGWDGWLDQAGKIGSKELDVVCPFIKTASVSRLLKRRDQQIRVITRFNLADFFAGVSDIDALRLLLRHGAKVRGIKNLHAKVYLFGSIRAIVTSANLTERALTRNHEFGFVAQDKTVVGACREFFEQLWNRGGANLRVEQLDAWHQQVVDVQARIAPTVPGIQLPDEGIDLGIAAEPIAVPEAVVESPQSFVKFFGESKNRAQRSKPVLEEVRGAGCHWACTYPKGKRPRQVQEGAVMYMGRLVAKPDDILIFGRAIGLPHLAGRDDATPADIQFRSWKANWPHYIRVHHAEFVAGTLSNGVALSQLMRELKSNSFASTQRNAGLGIGNADPRTAYRRLAAVKLSHDGNLWLGEALSRVFAAHGTLTPSDMATLDWPQIPVAN